jgi:hypothetical protein
MSPSQKEGMESMSVAKATAATSPSESCFQAASIPSGTAISTASATATTTVTSVTPKRSRMRGTTGSPLPMERPRSPAAIRSSQRRNCTGIGRSSPMLSRSAATASGVPESPRGAAQGRRG